MAISWTTRPPPPPPVRLGRPAAGRATVFAEFTVIALSENGASWRWTLPLALGSDCDITLEPDSRRRRPQGPRGARLAGRGASRALPGRRRLRERGRARPGLLLSFLDRERPDSGMSDDPGVKGPARGQIDGPHHRPQRGRGPPGAAGAPRGRRHPRLRAAGGRRRRCWVQAEVRRCQPRRPGLRGGVEFVGVPTSDAARLGRYLRAVAPSLAGGYFFFLPAGPWLRRG